ncbi:MAG: hypothetical protein IJT35_00150 [Paludibacteraceae bacterium]|nr:hypothetical protein [Paludibacteraceae bacterium]
MKKFLLLFCSFGIALTGFAKQYCDEPITSRDDHSATVTMSLVSGNIYEFSITTADNIVSFNAAGSNLYCNKDGVGGYHMSEYLVQNGNTLSMQFTSTEVPGIYANALFIVLEGHGEDMFSIPMDADWKACVTDQTEYAITLVQPATGGTIAADVATATYGTVVTLTATPAEGKQLDKWSVKDASNNDITVSKAGTFVMPASAVTVTATFKDKTDIAAATVSGTYTDEVSGAVFTYSITRNADQTLTFTIGWDKELEGVNPQVTVGVTQFAQMALNGNAASYTTENTFEDGETPVIFFYIAYTGNAARIDVEYTVGAGDTNPNPSAVEKVYRNDDTRVRKVMENGIPYFIRNGVRYNALGTVIR